MRNWPPVTENLYIYGASTNMRLQIFAVQDLTEGKTGGGGLLMEAIVIYKELKMYGVIGDLYRELEQVDEANAAYEKEFLRLSGESDFLSAARLCEAKLDSPERAFEILDNAWPNRNQSHQCLKESFQLMARRAWHERGKNHTLGPVLRACTVDHDKQLASLLSDVAAKYPDRELSDYLADQTWLHFLILDNCSFVVSS